MRPVDEALECRNVAAKVWYFDEGEEIGYHAHSEQEELFYVLEGTFSLKLGRSGEEEFVEADEGTFWVSAPKIGHGHRCVSEGGGAVLQRSVPRRSKIQVSILTRWTTRKSTKRSKARDPLPSLLRLVCSGRAYGASSRFEKQRNSSVSVAAPHLLLSR